MQLQDYRKLQNGSDIRGVAMEGIEGEKVNLTERVAYFIGTAFAGLVAREKQISTMDVKIIVGHDSRLTADSLKMAAISGMKAVGATVTDCHLASTPSLFMATVLPDLTYDGAVMLTASHLPFNRNGFKFFTNKGGLEKKEIAELLSLAYEKDSLLNGKYKICKEADEQYDLLSRYSEHLRELIKEGVKAANFEKPLSGLHIVVDAGNGAGGFFATKVLEPLGADIDGSQFLEPDGRFPNHVPNPENKEAMDAIRKATIEHHGDFGLIFDTDVDRAAAVFADGTEVSRNAFIALMAAIIAQEHPNTTVVTDSVTSDELAEFLTNEIKMKHHRFKRGYKNVINEAIRLNMEGEETCLAMETSGHGALKENYFLDDGAYLCVKMVIELARRHAKGEKMEDLIKGLGYPQDAAEFRLKIMTEDFAEYGNQVIEAFQHFCETHKEFTVLPNNYEGVRVSYQDEKIHGWILLRLSLHDPLLPLNIETKEQEGVAVIVEKIRDFFNKQEKVKW